MPFDVADDGRWYGAPQRFGGPPFWGDGSRPASASRLVLILPIVVSFLVQVGGTIGTLSWTRERSVGVWAVALLVAAVGPAALTFARRFPGPVVVVAVAAAVADLALLPEWGPPPLAAVFAIAGGIIRGARIWVYISLVAAWALGVGVAAFAKSDWQPFRIVGATIALAILVALSEGIRTRRERIATLRRRAAERRMTLEQTERVRIARELHDVLAHSLSQINVQAGVGLHLMDSQPEQARAALEGIKSTSKIALDEVRGVLGLLRADGAAPRVPEPDLARLPELAASAEAHGLVVTFDINVASEASAAIQHAVYRIAQESLTNAARHAHASRVDITVAEVAGSLVLTVRDNGTGQRADASAEAAEDGNGIVGMTERAQLLGGGLTAGNAESGGFVVTATLPLRGSQREPGGAS